MKTILKSLATLAVLFCAVIVAVADPVVFNVNMSVQAADGNFNPANGDNVLVEGLNNDWADAVTLTPSSGNPLIYTITTNLPVGTWEDYLFVIAPGNDGAWIWESPTSTGGGNRYFQVPPGGTNLPVVYFSDNTNMPSYTINITFQLDMAVQIQQGNFTQGSSYVDVFGSFNNWSETGILLTNVPGTSNYVGTFTTSALPTNTVVSYKYAIGGYGGTWEGNVGTNGTANREFTLTSTNQTLPVDYFNNVTSANYSFNIQFEVNMATEIAVGNFNPGSDFVFVNGDWNWTSYTQPLIQVGSSDLYTGAVTVAVPPGTTINYKYNLDGGITWENNGVGPGGAMNHQFMLAGNTNLPTDWFNNWNNLGPLVISQQGNQTGLSWPSGTNSANQIQLQTSTNLLTGWTDVPGTQGLMGVTNDFGGQALYFRITGP